MDPEALVTDNLPLVTHVLRRRGFGYLEPEDAFQVGRLALVNAVRKFDPTRGFRFSTFAVRVIENALVNATNGVRQHRDRECSLDGLLSEDGESLADLLPDPQAVSPERSGVQRVQREEIERILQELAPADAELIRLRFGLTSDGVPLTQAETAARLGFAVNGSWRRESRILRELRRRLPECQ